MSATHMDERATLWREQQRLAEDRCRDAADQALLWSDRADREQNLHLRAYFDDAARWCTAWAGRERQWAESFADMAADRGGRQ